MSSDISSRSTICVKNLADHSDQSLHNHFDSFGMVSFQLVSSSDANKKDILVEFQSEDSASKARNAMHGKVVDGNSVFVDYAHLAQSSLTSPTKKQNQGQKVSVLDRIIKPGDPKYTKFDDKGAYFDQMGNGKESSPSNISFNKALQNQKSFKKKYEKKAKNKSQITIVKRKEAEKRRDGYGKNDVRPYYESNSSKKKKSNQQQNNHVIAYTDPFPVKLEIIKFNKEENRYYSPVRDSRDISLSLKNRSNSKQGKQYDTPTKYNGVAGGVSNGNEDQMGTSQDRLIKDTQNEMVLEEKNEEPSTQWNNTSNDNRSHSRETSDLKGMTIESEPNYQLASNINPTYNTNIDNQIINNNNTGNPDNRSRSLSKDPRKERRSPSYSNGHNLPSYTHDYRDQKEYYSSSNKDQLNNGSSPSKSSQRKNNSPYRNSRMRKDNGYDYPRRSMSRSRSRSRDRSNENNRQNYIRERARRGSSRSRSPQRKRSPLQYGPKINMGGGLFIEKVIKCGNDYDRKRQLERERERERDYRDYDKDRYYPNRRSSQSGERSYQKDWRQTDKNKSDQLQNYRGPEVVDEMRDDMGQRVNMNENQNELMVESLGANQRFGNVIADQENPFQNSVPYSLQQSSQNGVQSTIEINQNHAYYTAQNSGLPFYLYAKHQQPIYQQQEVTMEVQETIQFKQEGVSIPCTSNSMELENEPVVEQQQQPIESEPIAPSYVVDEIKEEKEFTEEKNMNKENDMNEEKKDINTVNHKEEISEVKDVKDVKENKQEAVIADNPQEMEVIPAAENTNDTVQAEEKERLVITSPVKQHEEEEEKPKPLTSVLPQDLMKHKTMQDILNYMLSTGDIKGFKEKFSLMLGQKQ